ncbi:glycosyltransferase family 4 protein [Candidatus Dojkabacteria bacterium]|uniref:Glycosyltransferase family 4 protein n=1 Tax=Candidatus Dojkabacteria bacterium TaxID=2099670 RepID=A0A955L4Z8_9BACT|nr:glycosyltransferase family 4 protein [Candidatus Dojkabacteria bacterium]
MKIFQLTTFFHPVVGGVESHVNSLAEQLIGMGHEVTVLTSDSTKKGPRIKGRRSKLGDIEIVRFRNLLNLSYFHKFFPGVFFYLMRNDFDVIHVHGFRKSESILALLAAKLKKKKIVLTTHNPFPVGTRSRMLDAMIKLMDVFINKRFTKNFDKIITLVKSERKILHEEYNVPDEKMVTIPNGMEEMFLQQGDEEVFYRDLDIDVTKWDAVALGVGRINYVKGYQNLELAINRLKKVLFVFAGGDDGYLDKLKKQYRKNKNVIFTESFVPQEKLVDYYKGGDIFLFPSLHEAFGIVVLEALAQGLPVISSDQGGPKEFLSEKYSVLLDPEDQEGWKNAIEKLTSDSKLLEQMSVAGMNEVKKYSWDKVSKKILAVYESL